MLEANKGLHGPPTLVGEGMHVDGMHGESSRVRYPRREDCQGHEHLGELRGLGAGVGDVTIGALLERAEEAFGEGATIDLSRDVITSLACPACGDAVVGGTVLGGVRESQAKCPRCGTHRVVEIASSIRRGDNVDLRLTLAELGLPAFDVVVMRDGMERHQAWLLDGDTRVLGPLAESFRGKQGTT